MSINNLYEHLKFIFDFRRYLNIIKLLNKLNIFYHIMFIEFDNVGKNIALFFAIFVAFLACFVFGSIILKRHQLLTDISDVQVK